MMLDSTERVIKNQKMPKEMRRNFLKIQTPTITSITRKRKERKVGNAKRLWARG
jgi:hypothetical protein